MVSWSYIIGSSHFNGLAGSLRTDDFNTIAHRLFSEKRMRERELGYLCDNYYFDNIAACLCPKIFLNISCAFVCGPAGQPMQAVSVQNLNLNEQNEILRVLAQ